MTERAQSIAKRLLEGGDEPDDFIAKNIRVSELEQLLAQTGFKQADTGEYDPVKWVKKLSSGRTAVVQGPIPDFDDSREVQIYHDPRQMGEGRKWTFNLITPKTVCSYCNQERDRREKTCPHCKSTVRVNQIYDVQTLLQLAEHPMVYALSAFLERLATWPKGMPKPGE